MLCGRRASRTAAFIAAVAESFGRHLDRPPGELCVRCSQPATFRGLLQSVSMWGSQFCVAARGPIETARSHPANPRPDGAGPRGWVACPRRRLDAAWLLALVPRRLTPPATTRPIYDPTAPFLRPRGHAARLNPHGTLPPGTRCCWISIDIEDVGGRGLGRCPPPGQARPVPSICELASTHAARSH
jgi:hypothetical protein